MCGIAGFNWRDRSLGEKMNSSILHRGPDAGGVFDDEGVTLGNRRLAIIDLRSEANQPMYAGDLVIVYNGEIYNYKELRNELTGYNFKTESDTEVILAGYKKWGEDVVHKLNGIFAFAIWDKNKKELFCARDHMGVKPLYYYWNKEKFIFASEIKSIFEHDIPRVLNLESFNRYMRVLYSPEPETMVKDIYKLSPGNRLLLKDKDLKVEIYYKPQKAEKSWRYEDAKDAVRKTVEEAVQRQLVADVPVGVYLSGGIDSSAVLTSVSKAKKDVKTFSIGFDLETGEEKDKFNRDFNLAAETAKHFGADHHSLLISAKDVAESLKEVIGAIDDPVSNPTAIPMAHLSKFAKTEVTVALSGNGGDELFGGYDRYKTSRRRDLLNWFPWLKGGTALDRLEIFEFVKDPLLVRVVSSEYFRNAAEVKKSFARYVPDGNATEALMHADLASWLPDQALSLGDRMSMLGSLEERMPFLDRKVVGLAMSLPISFKVDIFDTKKMLKDAFRDELPEVLFKEPKRGWFSPGAKWLRRPEIERIAREVLSKEYHEPTADLFDWLSVQKMLDDHIAKREYNLTVLWAILTFQIWAKKYQISL